MKTKNEITKTFIKLAEIPSPSGEEKLMADWISNYFQKLGWKTWIDNTGTKNASNTGNVYAFYEIDPAYQTILFSAHLDTVQSKTELIKVLFNDSEFRSDGTTILGADNKSGVTSLVLLAKKLSTMKDLKKNILFFFPTREESGIMGSTFFHFSSPIQYGFNVDSSDKPGVFIYKSLGFINFSIVISGIAAHAAKEYEKSLNAIIVSSDLMLKLPLGKDIENGWTTNIGIINGGHSTNIVCDTVILQGEVRAYKKTLMDQKISEIKTICKSLSQKYNTTIQLLVDKKSYIPPFDGEIESMLSKICEKACTKIGIDYKVKASFSTSDSNNLNAKGFPVISVSRGGAQAHSKNETLLYDDLKNTIILLEEIIRICCL